MKKMNLTGLWNFRLDKEKKGIQDKFYTQILEDTISLPATVASAQKGQPNSERHTGYLTDPYFFEGYSWYSKKVDFSAIGQKEYVLHLERTRVTHIWVDEQYVGSCNSLCTPHEYNLTPYLKNKNSRLTIMVDNTSYPTKGGHMTSPDTQTNWNGITGEIYIAEKEKQEIKNVKIKSSYLEKYMQLDMRLTGEDSCWVKCTIEDKDSSIYKSEQELFPGNNQIYISLPEDINSWSEQNPYLYQLHLEWGEEPSHERISFGVRDFQAINKFFFINGEKTFLRGKHDGLIFPLTGYAPTDIDSWLKVFKIAKDYGINHYRFHTCCPPQAAFTAADQLGIYLEPELPFWGTITTPQDENHDEVGQQYLIQEGYRILDEFGNHPSFVMMSLGNELWGSKEKLNEILGQYRLYDDRHLYTQGSNNFQFVPCVLENEDFFCGVRFSKTRLFRGSYAMCDAPQGHIQTQRPNSNHNYDDRIRPLSTSSEQETQSTTTIQYGTGTKTVKLDANDEIIPNVPVVSHEIGQYAMYPDFTEIEKYTGVLQARNFEVFRERLAKTGMLDKADLFFKASGKLAVDCYKAELETALRSQELAGFQILDLQDFSGQGTALVGILNAFMENKGLISAKNWRSFCSDCVILAEFPQFTFSSGEQLTVGIKLACYTNFNLYHPKIWLSLWQGETEIVSVSQTNSGEYSHGTFPLQEMKLILPTVQTPQKIAVKVAIEDTEIENSYDIWLYPADVSADNCDNILITEDWETADTALQNGERVLFLPQDLNKNNAVEGAYCTDFWCYPMFNSISKSMNKPVPIGTLGLLIDDKHPVFQLFPTEFYTTAQWYDIISHSQALQLDQTEVEPIVWTIDNFERNHRLGNLWEVKVGEGRLLVCTLNIGSSSENEQQRLPCRWLKKSIIEYMKSSQFDPKQRLTQEQWKNLL